MGGELQAGRSRGEQQIKGWEGRRGRKHWHSPLSVNFGHKSLLGAPASPPSRREEILEIPHSKPRTFSWRAGNLGQLSVLAGGPQFTPLQNGEH